MVHADRIGFALIAALLATFTIAPSRAKAQESTYRLVDGWAEPPSGVEAWGQTIGVEVDDDGNLWVFHRCFSTSCDGGREDVTPVLKYDTLGRLVDSWGEGMFIWPHGFFLDNDGNVWTTDARGAGRQGPSDHEVHPGRPLS